MGKLPKHVKTIEADLIQVLAQWLITSSGKSMTNQEAATYVAAQGVTQGLLKSCETDGLVMISLTDRGRELATQLTRQANARNN